MSAIGTVGCSAKYSEPQRPRSSPDTVMNTSERRGRGFIWLKACASITTPVVPEASSSAPLQIESAPVAVQPLPPPATRCGPCAR